MTVHHEAHFEDDDLLEWTASEVTGDGAIGTSGAHPHTGSYGAAVDIVDGIVGDKSRVYKSGLNIAVGNYIFSSARWYLPTATFNPTADLYIMKIQEGGAPWGGMMVIMNSSRELFVYDSINSATYSQASPISVPLDQQVGLELEIYAHAAAGHIRLRQDGILIIEQTGIATQPTNNYDYALYGAYYVSDTMTYDLTFYFDEVYVQDAQKIWAFHRRTINDGVGVADSISRVAAYARPIAENIGVTDNLSRKVSFVRSIADNVGVTDVLSRAVAFARSIADNVGLTDVLSRAQTHRRAINENVGVTDTLSRIATFARSIADGVGLTDVLSAFHGYAGRFYKVTPPTTTWEKDEKPTTEWTKDEKPETEWEKE